jgi:F-type H+-transporting ATPase subunit alpha
MRLKALQNLSSTAPSPPSARCGRVFTPQLHPREVGTITSVSTGIAKVSGCPASALRSCWRFPASVFGIAFNVDEDEIGVVLLGDYWHLHAGDEVERTGRVMDVAVGDGCWGA